jgi:uncharacterized membrane protein YpjA
MLSVGWFDEIMVIQYGVWVLLMNIIYVLANDIWPGEWGMQTHSFKSKRIFIKSILMNNECNGLWYYFDFSAGVLISAIGQKCFAGRSTCSC